MCAPLTKTCGCLAVVLMLGGVNAAAMNGPMPEQSTTHAQTQEKAAPTVAQEPDQVAPRRPTRRSGRTQRRRPSAPTTGASRDARPSRVAEPTQQRLIFTASLLGGYDDNLAAGEGAAAGITPVAMASGSTGRLDATLDFFKGNGRHSVGVDTTGNLQSFPGYLDRPARGGAANIQTMTTLGRSTTLRASQRVAYDPLFNVFLTGAGGPLQPLAVEQVSPVAGLFERQSVASDSTGAMEHPWSRRDSTTLSYSYGVRRFIDDDTGDSTMHTVATGYRRTLSTGVKARTDYRYQDLAFVDTGIGTRSMYTHRVEGGGDIERGLSRQRHVTWTLLAGASYIASPASDGRLPYSAWMPTGSAGARLALSPSWNVEGSYRRDFTLLQGVTNEVYATDTASLTTGGLLSPRVDVLVGGTYGNWRMPVASEVDSTFDVYGGLLRLNLRLTASVWAVGSYNYYHHRFSSPAELPTGFPPTFGRHAVRFGIAVRFPLQGARSPQSAASR